MVSTRCLKQIYNYKRYWLVQRVASAGVLGKLANDGYLPLFSSGRRTVAVAMLNQYRNWCYYCIYGNWINTKGGSAVLFVGPLSDLSMLQQVLRLNIPVLGLVDCAHPNWLVDYAILGVRVNNNAELLFSLAVFNNSLTMIVNTLCHKYLKYVLLTAQLFNSI